MKGRGNGRSMVFLTLMIVVTAVSWRRSWAGQQPASVPVPPLGPNGLGLTYTPMPSTFKFQPKQVVDTWVETNDTKAMIEHAADPACGSESSGFRRQIDHDQQHESGPIQGGVIAPMPTITRPFWAFSSPDPLESPFRGASSLASMLDKPGTKGRSNGSRADRQSTDLLPVSRSSLTVSAVG